MKKYLLYIFVSFSFLFIGMSIVSAAEITGGYVKINESDFDRPIIGSFTESDLSILNTLPQYIGGTPDKNYSRDVLTAYNGLVNYFNSNYDSNYYDYIIYTNAYESGKDTNIYIFPKSSGVVVSLSYGTPEIGSWLITGFLYLQNPNHVECEFARYKINTSGGLTQFYNFKSTDGIVYSSNVLYAGTILNSSNNKILEKIQPNGGYDGGYRVQLPLFYDSTVDIKYIGADYFGNSHKEYWSKVIINGYEYNQGDVIFTKNNEIYQTPIYTFRETIDTSVNATLEVYFKVPNDKDFPFDLDLTVVSKGSDIPKPYLSVQDTFDIGDIQQIDNFLDKETIDNNGLEYTQYSGTYGITFLPKNYVKLTFDFGNYKDNYFIQFSSEYDYDLVYTTRQEVEDYFVTIDMKDIYGVYLIPKTVTRDVFVPIYLNGEYTIKLIKDYKEEKNVIKEFPAYEQNIFQYQFYFSDYNSIVYIQNLVTGLVENLYYVKYDSRYFVHEIRKTIYDTPQIVNPNTGDTLDTGTIDFDNELSNEDKKENFFSYITNIFNMFTAPILSIFGLITVFVNGLPIQLQYFFAGIFILSLVYYLYKFIL